MKNIDKYLFRILAFIIYIYSIISFGDLKKPTFLFVMIIIILTIYFLILLEDFIKKYTKKAR
ncbi:MAG: hypothetical protein RSB77_04315 [Bacilli bacterium]